MAKDTVLVIRGEFNWAKVTGTARPYSGNPKYDKGPYWSLDVTPDADSLAKIKAAGISKKLREPGENDSRTEGFLSLKVLENRADGSKNEPPRIVDVENKPWNGSLIGNGSIGEVRVKVKDYGSGSEKGAYLQAIRVLKHVPYEGGGFAEISEDDEFFAGKGSPEKEDTKGEAGNPDDLDDDIPY